MEPRPARGRCDPSRRAGVAGAGDALLRRAGNTARKRSLSEGPSAPVAARARPRPELLAGSVSFFLRGAFAACGRAGFAAGAKDVLGRTVVDVAFTRVDAPLAADPLRAIDVAAAAARGVALRATGVALRVPDAAFRATGAADDDLPVCADDTRREADFFVGAVYVRARFGAALDGAAAGLDGVAFADDERC